MIFNELFVAGKAMGINMDTILLIIILVLLILCVALLVVLLSKKDKTNGELVKQQIEFSSKATDEKITKLSSQMSDLTDKNYEQQIRLIETLNSNTKQQMNMTAEYLEKMQIGNEQKLEQMRKTVDEKLDETLGQRLNASFETVSKELKNVYKGLGEMKELSSNVTTSVSDLNRVLTNVKARGTWAEVLLKNILDETIPGLYDTNVQTNPNYNGRVEFAIKIPNGDKNTTCFLPIDSKFPMEDYSRLTSASQAGNSEQVAIAKKALEARIKDEAKLITQYVCPPHTTPFAIMYLATEGLYAEVVSSDTGLVEKLHSLGIMVAGPSTITALLNSLSMGFKTIAINEKATDVWKVLGAAKTQYEKFGDLLAKASKKIKEAGNIIDDAEKKNNTIQKNLKGVEALEMNEAERVLSGEV